MTPNTRRTIVRLFSWRGRLIQVRYEPEWLGSDRYAHLTLMTLQPPQAPLPMAETGYRSHFLNAEVIDEAGGPVAFAQAWLNEAAKSKRWIAADLAARQLSLF